MTTSAVEQLSLEVLEWEAQGWDDWFLSLPPAPSEKRPDFQWPPSLPAASPKSPPRTPGNQDG